MRTSPIHLLITRQRRWADSAGLRVRSAIRASCNWRGSFTFSAQINCFMKPYALATPAALLALVTAYAQTPFDSSIKPSLVPYEIPANRGAAALWQSLKKLHTRASLIMITAHPDDEDGATLA